MLVVMDNILSQNAIRHLENFASTSNGDPVLLTGQIWYDKNEKVMRVYDGTMAKNECNSKCNSTQAAV